MPVSKETKKAIAIGSPSNGKVGTGGIFTAGVLSLSTRFAC